MNFIAVLVTSFVIFISFMLGYNKGVKDSKKEQKKDHSNDGAE
jgi:hypothetical protein